jgi:flavodoxin
MKEITCKSGNKYGLAVAFGILSELEGAVFEVMDSDAVEEFKKVMSDGDEVSIGNNPELFKKLSGDAFKSFIIANTKHAPRMIAKVIRHMNGNPVGNSFEERLSFVYEELDYDDGLEIAEFVQSKIDETGGAMGESVPSTNPKGVKKAIKSVGLSTL